MSTETTERRDVLGAKRRREGDTNKFASDTVLGPVEKPSKGNITLRIGRLVPPEVGGGWEQTEHLVLETDEARTLVGELLALLGDASATQLMEVAVKRAAKYYGQTKIATDPQLWEVRTNAAAWVVEDMLTASGVPENEARAQADSLISTAAALLPDYS